MNKPPDVDENEMMQRMMGFAGFGKFNTDDFISRGKMPKAKMPKVSCRDAFGPKCFCKGVNSLVTIL